MNKKEYAGLREVFSFSFMQGIKSKGYISSIVIFSFLLIIGLPLFSLINKDDSKELGKTGISELVITDETDFAFDYENILKDDRYEDVEVLAKAPSEFEKLKKEMEDNPKSDKVLANITYAQGVFNITFVKSSSPQFEEKDYDKMTEDFQEGFEEAKIKALDVSAKQMEFVNLPVKYQVEYSIVSDDGSIVIAPKDKEEGISLAEYGVLLGGIVVVMMIVNMAGGQIANQIVTEKSTRVVEYLMINVRPMALICGKILSCLLQVVIEIGFMILAFFVGNTISSVFVGAENSSSDSAIAIFAKSLSDLSFGKLILCLAIILVGVLFFSIVAGLAGASVSKIEELAEGMKLYQLFLVSGSYVGIALCIMEMTGKVDNRVLAAVSLFPMATPFTLPANLILGKLGVGVGIAGLVILSVVTFLLYLFTARVYEAMIFYNGKVLKIKDIIGLARNKSGAAGRKNQEAL